MEFDLVLLSWSLLHALTLILGSLVFRVFKCFWDTRGERELINDLVFAIDPEGNIV